MISRHTSSVPKQDVVFPRLLYWNWRCSQSGHRCAQACGWHSQHSCRRFEVLQALSLLPPGLSTALPAAPRCTWRLRPWSSQLLDLITLRFWSDNFQIISEIDMYIADVSCPYNMMTWSLIILRKILHTWTLILNYPVIFHFKPVQQPFSSRGAQWATLPLHLSNAGKYHPERVSAKA